MSDNNRTGFGHDDSNRGPLDRAADAIGGHDDPNRGPLDRAANAVTGGSGGIGGALAGDHASSGSHGGMSHEGSALGGSAQGGSALGGSAIGGSALGGSTSGGSAHAGTSVVSAVFDSQEEAQRAVADLRSAGIDDRSLSVIAQKRGTMTTRDADGEITDEEHTNVLRGILGGGALGAGLGVVALAIPGVGPLAALGAIAASAVPEAMAIGAAVGAAAGTFNEVLLKHGVSEEDARYYGDHMKSGGVLVTVHASGSEGERAREILHRHGGHSSSRARSAAL
jgi:hypothetical protein